MPSPIRSLFRRYVPARSASRVTILGARLETLEDRTTPAANFAAAPAFTAGITSPNGLDWVLAKGDFNGDGQQDFVAHGGFGVNQFEVYLNQGGGSFKAATAPVYLDGVESNSLVVADFTSKTGLAGPDGFDDIAFLDTTLSTIQVLASKGNGTFQLAGTTVVDFTRISMAAGDLTGDGKPDLVLGRFGGGGPGGTFGEYEVEVNNGNGTFTEIDRTASNGLSWIANQPVIADIDGDGKMDFVANSLFPVNNQGLAGVYYGNGDGTFTRTSKFFLPGNINTDNLAVGDFDGNGRPDVAVVSGSTFYVYYQSAAGVFPNAPTSSFTTSNSPTDIAVADFDFDGRADIAITPFSAIDPAVRVYQGPANQTFTGGGGISFATAGTNTPIVVIDGDQNGTPDLLVGTFASGNVAKYQYLQNIDTPPTPVTSVVGLTATPNPAAYAAPVTLSSKVNRLGNIPTGSVTFFNGATVLGTANLDATGKAAISLSTFPVGTTVVQAVYSGDGNYTGGTSPARSVVVNPILAATTISFTTLLPGPPFQSIFGQTAVFTAKITPVAGATPTGTFQFFAGATATTPFGSATVDATGKAVLTTTQAPFGTYKVLAVFSGDPLYADATATSANTLKVSKLPTQTELIVSSNPSVYGLPLSYTINVTTTLPGALAVKPVFSGAVSIFDNSNIIAVVNVDSNGTALYALPGNYAIGTHTVSASYTGTTSINASSSPLFDVVITKAPTAATLTVAPSPANFGDPLTLTAHVGITIPGGGSPGGTVVFSQGGNSLGSAALDASGNAIFPVTGLPAGTYTFAASYLGTSGSDAADAAAQTVVVNPTTSSTTLSANPSAATLGGPVVLTANVKDAGGRGVNVGTVTFTGSANGVALVLPAAVTVVNGVATATVPNLPIGAAQFSASFSGDVSINGSATASPTPVTVARAVGTLALSSSDGTSATLGKKLTLTATYTRPAGLAVTAGGSVVFKDNGTPFATVALTGDKAVYTGEFTRGAHTVTADYSGDTSYFPASSSFAFTVFRPTDSFTAGAGSGGFDRVKVYNADGSVRFSPLYAFGPDHTAGVRVATADFDRDGVQDFVVGTGPGVGSRVRILNGLDGKPLFDFSPFGEDFFGGVYVSAGDVTGDGVPDLVVTPDRGGGARVRVINGATFQQVADFYGLIDGNGNADVKFRGGSRAAIGDINGDGFGDIVFAAGFGGGPRVAIFSGKGLTSKGAPKLTADFFAFEKTLRNGSFVAVGDTNGDGYADVIAGAGPGGGPRVSVFSGQDLLKGTQTRLADFYAGNESSRGGVPVAARYLDSDELLDVVAGSGPGSDIVTTYLGKNLKPNGFPTPTLSFDAFADTGDKTDATRGVFVG